MFQDGKCYFYFIFYFLLFILYQIYLLLFRLPVLPPPKAQLSDIDIHVQLKPWNPWIMYI